MNIINRYDALSNKIIKEDKEIKNYEKELASKKITISCLFAKPTTYLKPLKLIRLVEENRRLKLISKDLKLLKDTSVLNNMDEESGDLNEDLHNSAFIFKPRRIKKYMKNNKIYDEEIDKKLRLIKK